MLVLENLLLREIGNLARAIQTINEEKYKTFGLQKNQFVFLTRIVERQGIYILDLADLLRSDKTTTSKAVQKLVEKGYIRKEQSAADKRIFRLFPTEKCLNVYEEIIAEENRALALCLQNFSAEEQVLAESLVRRMNQNVEKIWLEIKNRGEKI